MEAIVCVGDNVAIGAQEYLIKQGYQVPHDIAVCGFNGTDDAAWCNPPITTVEMPFHGIGVKAFSTLMDKISGKPTPEEFRYSTSLVLGESCGCKSLSVKKATLLAALTDEKSKSKKKVPLKCLFSGNGSDKAEIAESELKDEKWQKRTRKMVLEDIESTTSSEDSTLEFFKENAPRLIQLYAESVVSLDSENTEFIIEFGKTLNKFLCISTKFRLWQDFLSVLSMNSQAIISSTIFESVSASILQQARILIHEFDSRQQKQKSLWDLRYDADLRNTSADLLSSYNISELMDILHKSLKKLKIPGVYVVLYENCEYTPKNNKIPKKSRLVLAVRDNERLNLKKDGFEFDTEKIIPDQFLPQSNFYSLVLESLNFQDKFIGYIVFQEGPRTGGPYTAIRDQLSSSLYGALLLGELNENKDSVESAMRNMSNKADLVATHSKSISGSINTISNSMESVTENIRNISDNIMTVSETVSAASQMIDEANLSITNLVSSTERISQAITMINDISETINVLALNASIEASHAGDAGKGFSVVAKEVKVLAAKTMSTTEMIFELVTKNNKNTQAAKKVMLQTASSIKKISELSESIQNSVKDQVNSTSTVSSQIANASSGTTEISKAIDEIAEIGSSFKSKDDEKSATI
jgi:archaellum component FlaC